MKKLLLGLISTLFSLSIMVWMGGSRLVLATNEIPNPLPDELKDLPSVIQYLTGRIFPLVALGLLTMLIYAGVTRLTAAGDAEKEKKSMQIIMASVTGFVIIALAGVIVNTLCAVLGVQCF
jgi:ABC-type multidrug transport system permease subunit